MTDLPLGRSEMKHVCFGNRCMSTALIALGVLTNGGSRPCSHSGRPIPLLRCTNQLNIISMHGPGHLNNCRQHLFLPQRRQNEKLPTLISLGKGGVKHLMCLPCT